MLKPIITPNNELPVTVDQLKAQSIIDFADDDGLLAMYLKAAVNYVDGFNGVLGRALMRQTVVQSFEDFSDLSLPYGDVIEVTSVEYVDTDGITQQFEDFALIRQTPTEYLFLTDDEPAVYDRPDAVTVTYEAGWATADAVPSDIKLAILMLAATWYEARQTTYEGGMDVLPFSVRDLLSPYRRVGL